jgi:bla regulator protein BlaR1
MTPASLSPIWAGEVCELCNHLWQSTLFLGIVALLALLMRKNQARIRYWLWMAASAKFLIPFSLLISLGSPFALAQPCGGTEDHCLRRNRRD